VKRPSGLDLDWCEAVIPASATSTVSAVSGRASEGRPYAVSWEGVDVDLNPARI